MKIVVHDINNHWHPFFLRSRPRSIASSTSKSTKNIKIYSDNQNSKTKATTGPMGT